MIPLIAELPDSGYLVISCIVIALVTFVGFNAILREARSFRTALADELRREITAAKEPARVDVQSPLVIKAHVGLTPLDKHEALASDFNELKEQRRKDVSGLYFKIEQGIDGVRKDIASEFKEVRGDMADRREDIAKLQTETNTQTRQLGNLDTKIDRILERLPRQS